MRPTKASLGQTLRRRCAFCDSSGPDPGPTKPWPDFESGQEVYYHDGTNGSEDCFTIAIEWHCRCSWCAAKPDANSKGPTKGLLVNGRPLYFHNGGHGRPNCYKEYLAYGSKLPPRR